MIDRDNDLHPPFCRRSLLVRPDGSAVDHLDVAVMCGSDGIHHPVPHACFPPSNEAVVTSGTRAIALGKISPWGTGSQHPKDAVQHAAVIDTGHPSGFVRQQRLDHAPLEICQVISAHANAESHLGCVVKYWCYDRRHGYDELSQPHIARSCIRPSRKLDASRLFCRSAYLRSCHACMRQQSDLPSEGRARDL